MRRLILPLVSLLLLSACAYGDDVTIGGRIVLWYNEDADMQLSLNALIERFEEINPDIRVSMVAVPEDEMLRRYTGAAELSLGPDLFIGDSTWIVDLADDGLIQPLNQYEPVLDRYLSAALINIIYDDDLYGVPFGLSQVALIYNADLVTTLPDSLTALLEQAANGLGVAMSTQFSRAFWGVRAFGGRLFNEDGMVTLDQGGFASWLIWLNSAQNSTGMFLNNDRATLMNLFTSERVAYYVGTVDDLSALQEAMGPDASIRVASLPAGPNGAAGPLLHLDTFMFNSASAPRNTRAALTLAQFLTNNENSLRLARETGHIPSNVRVPGIDERTYPDVNGFMTGARTAVPILNTDTMAIVLENGDRLYRQVLDGGLDPTIAASQFTSTINQIAGFEDVEPQQVTCLQEGDINVWHSWQDVDRTALNQIVERFESQCPDINVTLTPFSRETELMSSYHILYNSNLKPDVVLLADTRVYELASNNRIQPIQGELLQQFFPSTLNAVTYQNAVYGTPMSLWMTVMFYNPQQVLDPARTLTDLTTEAVEGNRVAINATFESAYWGLSVFGGSLFGPDLSLAVNQNGGFQGWLEWLAQAHAMPGFLVDSDTETLEEAFINGDVAYYIGPANRLRYFEDQMGEDSVVITGLPTGPMGSASPVLRTDAWMINASVVEEDLEPVLAFISFVTGTENQQILFEQTRRFPASVNIQGDASPTLTAIQSQVTGTTILPNIPEIEPVLESGDDVYRAVLEDGVPPDVAAAGFVQMVNDANEIVVQDTAAAETTAEAAAPSPEVTEEPAQPAVTD